MDQAIEHIGSADASRHRRRTEEVPEVLDIDLITRASCRLSGYAKATIGGQLL
jgi:hypothetical protein